MTRKEIMELVRQAGIRFRQDVFYSGYCDGVHGDELEAFAKLVAAKEREQIILLSQDLKFWDDSESLIRAIRARGEA